MDKKKDEEAKVEDSVVKNTVPNPIDTNFE